MTKRDNSPPSNKAGPTFRAKLHEADWQRLGRAANFSASFSAIGPLRRLLSLAPIMQAALVFAYWLGFAAALILAGAAVLGALLGSFMMLGVLAASCYWLYWAEQRREGGALGQLHFALSLAITSIVVGFGIMIPLCVYVGLGLYWLISLPLALR